MNLILALTTQKMPLIDVPMQFSKGTPVKQQEALSITEIVLSILVHPHLSQQIFIE